MKCHNNVRWCLDVVRNDNGSEQTRSGKEVRKIRFFFSVDFPCIVVDNLFVDSSMFGVRSINLKLEEFYTNEEKKTHTKYTKRILFSRNFMILNLLCETQKNFFFLYLKNLTRFPSTTVSFMNVMQQLGTHNEDQFAGICERFSFDVLHPLT